MEPNLTARIDIEVFVATSKDVDKPAIIDWTVSDHCKNSKTFLLTLKYFDKHRVDLEYSYENDNAGNVTSIECIEE